MGQVEFREFELPGFQLRFDLLNKMQVGLFRLGVVRVAGHGDVAARGHLVNGGIKFAPVQQPLLEVGGGGACRGAGFQLVKERGDIIPVSQVNLLGDKAAGLMRGQDVKWQ